MTVTMVVMVVKFYVADYSFDEMRRDETRWEIGAKIPICCGWVYLLIVMHDGSLYYE